MWLGVPPEADALSESEYSCPLASLDLLVEAELRMTEQKNGKPRFALKSATHYVQVIQMVVGSALNDKGEAI